MNILCRQVRCNIYDVCWTLDIQYKGRNLLSDIIVGIPCPRDSSHLIVPLGHQETLKCNLRNRPSLLSISGSETLDSRSLTTRIGRHREIWVRWRAQNIIQNVSYSQRRVGSSFDCLHDLRAAHYFDCCSPNLATLPPPTHNARLPACPHILRIMAASWDHFARPNRSGIYRKDRRCCD